MAGEGRWLGADAGLGHGPGGFGVVEAGVAQGGGGDEEAVGGAGESGGEGNGGVEPVAGEGGVEIPAVAAIEF